MLGSAEAVEDWDGEVISWLDSAGGWGVRFSEELVVSEGWRVCRSGRLAGRDWGSGRSSSGCHVGLPGMLGWARVKR